MTASESEIVCVPYEEAYETGFEDMVRRVPDTSRINALLGWSPANSLEDVIRDVVEHQQTAAMVL
jgi:UDP-glucose 4-epimerase